MNADRAGGSLNCWGCAGILRLRNRFDEGTVVCVRAGRKHLVWETSVSGADTGNLERSQLTLEVIEAFNPCRDTYLALHNPYEVFGLPKSGSVFCRIHLVAASL